MASACWIGAAGGSSTFQPDSGGQKAFLTNEDEGGRMNEPAGAVTIRAKQGHAEHLAELLVEMARLAAMDDGCVFYAVHRSDQDPDVFVIYELYRNEKAHKHHQANQELRVLSRNVHELTDSIEVVLGHLMAGDRVGRP